MPTLFGLFDRPPLFQLGAFAIFSTVAWLAARLLLARLNERFRAGAVILPVAPFFASITTIFALFLGFLAADIWAQKHRASDAAFAERSAIQRYVTLAGVAAPDVPGALAAVERYRRAVIEEEWEATRNQRAAPAAEAALGDMWRAAASLPRAGVPPGATAHLLSVVEDIEQARAVRLAIGADHGGSNAWATALVLCLFSYLAIATVHLDRPAAARVALTMFAVATAAAFWFLALHDSPYAGGVRLDSDLLLAVRAAPPD